MKHLLALVIGSAVVAALVSIGWLCVRYPPFGLVVASAFMLYSAYLIGGGIIEMHNASRKSR